MARPLLFGNYGIASRVVRGDCKLCISPGDSITGVTGGSINLHIMQTWRPAKHVGMVCVASQGAGDGIGGVGDIGSALFSANYRIPSATPGPNSLTNYSCGISCDLTYGAGSFVASGGNLNLNRVMFGGTPDAGAQSFFVSPTQGGDGLGHHWLYQKTPKVDFIFVGNNKAYSQNAANTLFPVLRWGNRNSTDGGGPTATFNLNRIGPASTNVISVPFNVANGPGGVGVDYKYLQFTINGTDSQTPSAGDNLICLGARVYTGEVGFQIDNQAVGGSGLNSYWDSSGGGNWTSWIGQLAFGRYHLAVGTNTFLFLIGQNDLGLLTKAQYKTAIQNFATQCKSFSQDARMIFVSTFDTSVASGTLRSVYDGFADALYEVAQTDGRILFIDLLAIMGGGANLYQSYQQQWVTGLSYYEGVITQSPANSHYYVAKTTAFSPGVGVSTTDPSLDATNWTDMGTLSGLQNQYARTSADQNLILADSVHPNFTGKRAVAQAIWDCLVACDQRWTARNGGVHRAY